MASIELPDLERKILPECNFLWKQTVTNHSLEIIELCGTDLNISEFFKECQQKIIKGDKEAKILWNNEIQKFRGDEFGYVWLFFSDILKTPIKITLKIDVMEKVVIIGSIDIASRKEEKKINKHLNTSTPTIGLQESSADNSISNINRRGDT